jgi:hypothetical protein
MVMLHRTLGTLFALTFLASGCSVYDASLVQGGGTGGTGSLPTRPPTETSTDADAETLVFAIRDVVLNQGDDWRRIGLDLDGIDTESPDFVRECTAVNDMGQEQATEPDGEGGIDNVFGHNLWPVIQSQDTIATLECEIASSHERGHGTLLLRVQGWNGQSNDSKVTAAMASAIDGTSVANADQEGVVTWEGVELMKDGMTAADPAWDGSGNDYFFLNPRGFTAGGDPKVRDSNAYIVNDVLVMNISGTAEFELLMENRSVPITLTQGTILAPMNAEHSEITGAFIAGRYPIDRLGDVGRYIGVCGDNQAALNGVYRAYADVLQAPRMGDADPTLDCEAVSMAVGFSASTARWAGLAPEPQDAPVWCDTMPPVPTECD